MKQRNKRLITEVLIFLLVIVVLVLFARSCGAKAGKASGSTDFSAGISRIQALEAQDPTDVDTIIKANRRERLISMRNELGEKLESGEISVWSLFEDYVILGDSRGHCFNYIPEMDKSRNLSVIANTAVYIPDNYEDVAALNPSTIILIFGVNDMLRSDCTNTEDYKAYFIPIVQDLMAHFPDATVYINPLFPCIDAGLARHEIWQHTAEYDQAIREIAKETGMIYVNCDDIVMKDEYYLDDGLHFGNEFNEIWAKHMILTIYDTEIGLDDYSGNSGGTMDYSASTGSEPDAEPAADESGDPPDEEPAA